MPLVRVRTCVLGHYMVFWGIGTGRYMDMTFGTGKAFTPYYVGLKCLQCLRLCSIAVLRHDSEGP